MKRGWKIAVVGLGLMVVGCGGSGTAPKAQADFWLINGTHDFATISVDVPGQTRQSLGFGGEYSTALHPVAAFDGEVVVRDQAEATVLSKVRVQADSETITKLFVTGRSDGEVGFATQTLPVQVFRRDLDLSAVNFRVVNTTRDNTVDLYFVPVGGEIPDRAPDVAALAPNAASPLFKRPAGVFDIVATAAGTKTWQGVWMGNEGGLSWPGYWTFAVNDLPMHKTEVTFSPHGSAF